MDFFFGEEIKIRLSFTHNDDIFAVEAVYAHYEKRTYTLTLRGNPELDEEDPTVGRKKRSTVELSGDYNGAHVPGRYGIERLIFYTLAGHAFHDDASVKEITWRVLQLHPPTHTVTDLKVESDAGD